MSLIEVTEKGFYCEQGGFHIDPWGEVDVALITHGHADHARRGAARYLAAKSSETFLHYRLGEDAVIKAIEYGKDVKLGSRWVSFHPAGHVLGSAQIRIEHGGEVWVVSGDYTRASDPTCEPFEVVPCDCFITEATFGLPIYSLSGYHLRIDTSQRLPFDFPEFYGGGGTSQSGKLTAWSQPSHSSNEKTSDT